MTLNGGKWQIPCSSQNTFINLINVNLGDVRIEIGEVFESPQRAYDQQHAQELVRRIQDEHKRMVTVTTYHLGYYEKKMAQRASAKGGGSRLTVEALLEQKNVESLSVCRFESS